MSFNLRVTAREIIEANETTDPGELANLLFPLVPESEYAGLVQSHLRNLIREIQAADFRATAPELQARVFEDTQSWVDDEADPNMLPKPRVKSRSRFAATLRAEYADWLDATVDVAGVRIRRAALTFTDLMTVAASRRNLAASNVAVAEELELHAATLREYDVETIGQLPAEVLKKLAGV